MIKKDVHFKLKRGGLSRLKMQTKLIIGCYGLKRFRQLRIYLKPLFLQALRSEPFSYMISAHYKNSSRLATIELCAVGIFNILAKT